MIQVYWYNITGINKNLINESHFGVTRVRQVFFNSKIEQKYIFSILVFKLIVKFVHKIKMSL